MTKKINNNKVVVILGATSSGKTALAVKLADLFNGEIVSADSRQVYKGMDIGTGKDLAEYTVIKSGRQKIINHHLIDVASPKARFSLAKYQKLATAAIDDILSRHKLPIIVGGSGLYLQAVVDNYQLSSVKPDLKLRRKLATLNKAELQSRLAKLNPNFFSKLNNSDLNNPRRLIRYLEILSAESKFRPRSKPAKYDFIIFGLRLPQTELNQRIEKRLLSRLEEGLVSEVKGLRQSGISYKKLESFGLEYKYVAWFLQEKIDYEKMVETLTRAICRFSKQQTTWFKRLEKQNWPIIWSASLGEAKKIIKQFIS